MRFRSWFKFLVLEIVGYRRPSPVTKADLYRRVLSERRESELTDRLHAIEKLTSALTPIERIEGN